VLAEGDYADRVEEPGGARKPIWERDMAEVAKCLNCSEAVSRRPQAWYGESHILHGVDFDVRGEVVTLLGRNGAGKTTTLKSIMGIVGKRTGSVHVRGQGD
jgi:ABC-type polysaccharide/polyol phosphate transport system ATPase subunit